MVEIGDARLPARFWSKVKVLRNGCWRWMGSQGHHGYGQVWWRGKMRKAHRVAWLELVGPIEEETLDHVAARGCVTKACVNPAHLEPVSVIENIRRSPWCGGAPRDRLTSCKRGHALEAGNLKVRRDGTRECLTCVWATMRAWKLRRKLARVGVGDGSAVVPLQQGRADEAATRGDSK